MGQAVFQRIQFPCNYFRGKLAGIQVETQPAAPFATAQGRFCSSFCSKTLEVFKFIQFLSFHSSQACWPTHLPSAPPRKLSATPVSRMLSSKASPLLAARLPSLYPSLGFCDASVAWIFFFANGHFYYFLLQFPSPI